MPGHVCSIAQIRNYDRNAEDESMNFRNSLNREFPKNVEMTVVNSTDFLFSRLGRIQNSYPGGGVG
jgi:hypothetical protein